MERITKDLNVLIRSVHTALEQNIDIVLSSESDDLRSKLNALKFFEPG